MKLSEIQQALKAPKNQKNNFGGYKYRSCEDILEAVKPLLGANTLTLSDEIVGTDGRFYIKATATFEGDKTISVDAYAREPEVKKGMDASQITGACSSYARKYALNGLFLIDDTRDADTMKSEPNVEQVNLSSVKSLDELRVKWEGLSEEEQFENKEAFSARRKEIELPDKAKTKFKGEKI